MLWSGSRELSGNIFRENTVKVSKAPHGTYAKKPMRKEDLAKKGGFVNTHTLDKHRQGGNPFGHPKDWKPKRSSK
jgi:hypothetical protein